MALFGRGFGRGLQQGASAAKGWVDTYRESSQNAELKDIFEQGAQDPQRQFTSEQGQQLEDMASNGHEISYDQNTKSYVATPTDQGSVDGGNGLNSRVVSPDRYNYMGRDYDHAPTDGERMSEQYGRAANVMAKYGNVKGAMGLRKDMFDMKNADRANERADRQLGMQEKESTLRSKHVEGQIADADTARSRLTDLHSGIETAMQEQDPDKQRGALIEAYNRYDPKMAAELKATYTKEQLSEIALRGAKYKDGFNTAFQEGGLEGAVKWYSSVNNQMDAKLIQKDGQYYLYHYPEGNPKGAVLMGKGDYNTVAAKLQGSLTVTDFMEMAKQETDIAAKKASANRDNAAAQYYRNGGSASTKETINDKIGAYAQAFLASGEAKTSEEAKKMAARAMLKMDRPAPNDLAPDKMYELRGTIEDRLASRVPNWKAMSPQAKQQLVDRELATVMHKGNGPASTEDPYAAAMRDDERPGLKPPMAARQPSQSDSYWENQRASHAAAAEGLQMSMARTKQAAEKAYASGDKAQGDRLTQQLQAQGMELGKHMDVLNRGE